MESIAFTTTWGVKAHIYPHTVVNYDVGVEILKIIIREKGKSQYPADKGLTTHNLSLLKPGQHFLTKTKYTHNLQNNQMHVNPITIEVEFIQTTVEM